MAVRWLVEAGVGNASLLNATGAIWRGWEFCPASVPSNRARRIDRGEAERDEAERDEAERDEAERDLAEIWTNREDGYSKPQLKRFQLWAGIRQEIKGET